MPQVRENKMLPNEYLDVMSKKFPNAWKLVDAVRQSRGSDLPKWPAWCFLPMAGWYTIVSDACKADQLDVANAADINWLAAVGTWRYSQGIYQFDNEFYHSVINTLLIDELPSEVFYRLPEWCLYIETPGMEWLGSPAHGFWCHLEWDTITEGHELRVLINVPNLVTGVTFHIGSGSVHESIGRALVESQKLLSMSTINSFKETALSIKIAHSLTMIISLILYVCSDNPEIEDLKYPGDRPSRPKATKTKKGWELFPADKPRLWRIGEKIGQSLRHVDQLKETGNGARTVQPDLDHGRWQGRWEGPKDHERFHYKWLPPMLVTRRKDEDHE